MSACDIIVIGASAGGVNSLIKLIGGLPSDLPAALFVVLHVSPSTPSLLPGILNRSGGLLALHPIGSAPVHHGCIYVAPPDRHLIVHGGRVLANPGPKEGARRPSIDTLFRSAAQEYGPRVVGVVLSGALDDGTAGLLAIKEHGGLAMVQDPADSLFTGMPLSALGAVEVDCCLPVASMPEVLSRLAREGAGPRGAGGPGEGAQGGGAREGGGPGETPGPAAARGPSRGAPLGQADPTVPVAVAGGANGERRAIVSVEQGEGAPSEYSCPECGGVLWELRDQGLLEFRCRVGHRYSEVNITAQQSEGMERALWVALKIIEERASLARRLATRAERRGHAHMVRRYETQAREAESHGAALRDVLAHHHGNLMDGDDALAEAGGG